MSRFSVDHLRRNAGSVAASASAIALTLTAALLPAPPAEAAAAPVAVDLAALRGLEPGDRSTIAGVRLDREHIVDLAVERFTVTSPRTRFVRGRDGAPLDFDPSRVVLLRGEVAGTAGSRVFLALSPYGTTGFIQLADTGRVYGLSSRGADGRVLPADRLSVFPSRPGGGASLPVPMCGVRPGTWAPPVSGGSGEPTVGRKQLELAIETDYEYFGLFDNLDEAGAYVVTLYGIVSDIFQRDTNTRVDLTFVRLWDDPDDLFNGDSPLNEFRDYWNANMGDVQRDAAQFLSGRRNLGYGGVAWLSSLCGDFGYSVCVYTLGYFADPERPDVYHRDIVTTAHELGHNAGTPHTHDLGVDTCNDETSDPQRGTIMAYCGQTFTGGDANMDLRFHAVVQEVLEAFIASVGCVVDDCNENGISDADDIAGGASRDDNGNGIPDECEDCNGNGTLDDEDIRNGRSDDLNSNGIPDECEADCDMNGVPDDLDIALGAPDANGNGIPDECEADCNGNGTPDYDELQADMSLDLNRNAILDACEDCDGDGVTDLDALEGAFDIWIASLDHTSVRSYLSRYGTLVDVSDDAGIGLGQDLLITPGGDRMLVTSALDDRVLAFDLDGSFLGDLVASGVGGLRGPAGLAFTAAGDLLVASRGSDEVLRYDATDGTFLGAFVTAASGGLTEPFGLTIGPGGMLFVTSNDGQVLAYDGGSGSFLGVFVTTGDNGGLVEPRGLLFVPATGNLLVASWGTNQILEYDGTSGAFVRQFNQGGTANRITLDQPWGLRIGPEGDVYVSRSRELKGQGGGPDGILDLAGWLLHLSNARIYHFNAVSGLFERSYVLGVDSGIAHPTGFDFVPGVDIDCNLNLIPDSCDIASGTSRDDNRNGVPDECESCIADLDGSGAVDFADILAILAAWGNAGGPEDLNGSGEVEFGDILVVLAAWGPCP